MDRLCSKNILSREKKGKKFFYRTTYSNYEIIRKSLDEISQKYCSGNMAMLLDVLKNMQPEKQLTGV
jgi:predicted transcriptional regulator